MVLLDVVVPLTVVEIVVADVCMDESWTVEVEVVDVLPGTVVKYLVWVTVVLSVFGIDSIVVDVLSTVSVLTVTIEVRVLVMEVVPM